jgi:acyl-CoA thioester hydrolase
MMETYRVCFADTDAGGIVYHARYFEMAERSRNAALQSVGLPPSELLRRSRRGDGAGLVVHRGIAKFVAPAFPDDLLILHTDIPRHNAARSWWRTEITRDGTPICTIEVELVCLNVMTGQPLLAPAYLLDAIAGIARQASAVPPRAKLVAELVSV